MSSSSPSAGPRDRPHILYIIDELRRMGGAERVLLNTVKQLSTSRFSCSVVTFKIDPNLDALREFPCPLHVFPLRKTYDCNAFQVALRLRSLVRTECVAIAHTFFETSDLWGGLVARLSGCPIVISSRRDMGIFRSPKHDVAYRLLRSQFDMVLTVSEAVRDVTMRKDHLAPERVRTLHNGFELDRATSPSADEIVRPASGLWGSGLVVATVANIRKIKGIDVLLRAAAVIRKEFQEAKFLIVGGVSEAGHFQELRALVQALNLEENVRFLGEIGDIKQVLRECTVFCLPSRSEGFSNALIEAMGCGLPCVATRVGGNAEALEEGKSGYLVASEDAAAMADRILQLLRDPVLARRMGQAARETVRTRFSMDAMMNRLIGIYDELLVAKHV